MKHFYTTVFFICFLTTIFAQNEKQRYYPQQTSKPPGILTKAKVFFKETFLEEEFKPVNYKRPSFSFVFMRMKDRDKMFSIREWDLTESQNIKGLPGHFDFNTDFEIDTKYDTAKTLEKTLDAHSTANLLYYYLAYSWEKIKGSKGDSTVLIPSFRKISERSLLTISDENFKRFTSGQYSNKIDDILALEGADEQFRNSLIVAYEMYNINGSSADMTCYLCKPDYESLPDKGKAILGTIKKLLKDLQLCVIPPNATDTLKKELMHKEKTILNEYLKINIPIKYLAQISLPVSLSGSDDFWLSNDDKATIISYFEDIAKVNDLQVESRITKNPIFGNSQSKIGKLENVSMDTKYFVYKKSGKFGKQASKLQQKWTDKSVKELNKGMITQEEFDRRTSILNKADYLELDKLKELKEDKDINSVLEKITQFAKAAKTEEKYYRVGIVAATSNVVDNRAYTVQDTSKGVILTKERLIVGKVPKKMFGLIPTKDSIRAIKGIYIGAANADTIIYPPTMRDSIIVKEPVSYISGRDSKDGVRLASTFYQIEGNRFANADENEYLLVQRRSLNENTYVGYGLHGISGRIDFVFSQMLAGYVKSWNIAATKLYGQLNLDFRTLKGTGKQADAKITILSFGFGLSKEFYLQRNYSLAPYLGAIVESAGYSDAATAEAATATFGDAYGQSNWTFDVGVRAGRIIGHRLRLMLTLGFAPISYEKNQVFGKDTYNLKRSPVRTEISFRYEL